MASSSVTGARDIIQRGCGTAFTPLPATTAQALSGIHPFRYTGPDGQEYDLTVNSATEQLTCTCPGSQHGAATCKHRIACAWMLGL